MPEHVLAEEGSPWIQLLGFCRFMLLSSRRSFVIAYKPHVVHGDEYMCVCMQYACNIVQEDKKNEQFVAEADEDDDDVESQIPRQCILEAAAFQTRCCHMEPKPRLPIQNVNAKATSSRALRREEGTLKLWLSVETEALQMNQHVDDW